MEVTEMKIISFQVYSRGIKQLFISLNNFFLEKDISASQFCTIGMTWNSFIFMINKMLFSFSMETLGTGQRIWCFYVYD